MSALRAVLVDDEPLARLRLRELLEDAPDFRVVFECADGDEAVERLGAMEPDVVFLDVEMPGRDGFGVLEALGTELDAQVVFVTAYDRYAVKAFEVCALDYLLKPVDRERFHAALERVRARHAAAPTHDEAATEASAPRLVARRAGRATVLRPEEVDWIEAAGNYLLLHAADGTHLMRATLGAVAELLAAAGFVRIHRSTLVRVDAVRAVRSLPTGDASVQLRGGAELAASRTYRAALNRALDSGRPR